MPNALNSLLSLEFSTAHSEHSLNPSNNPTLRPPRFSLADSEYSLNRLHSPSPPQGFVLTDSKHLLNLLNNSTPPGFSLDDSNCWLNLLNSPTPPLVGISCADSEHSPNLQTVLTFENHEIHKKSIKIFETYQNLTNSQQHMKLVEVP